MATQLKFLHASDLHLDQAISGLAGIPPHLRETLVEAPWQTAETLFDLAISEQVDFVVLAGDVVDLNLGGPRAISFLLSQFERLASKGIFVYWCAGSVDQPDRMPTGVQWPDNVTIFPSTMVEHASHMRNNRRIATICGAGYDTRKRNPADFRCDAETPFPIALVHGEFDTAGLAGQNIRYWALGGRHKRAANEKSGCTVVYPGTPQSRQPSESGTHSCTLVSVEAATSQIRLTEIEIDSVRWISPRLTVSENATLDDLKASLADRCAKISSQSSDQLVLVHWEITTSGTLNLRLRSDSWQQELVQWLRAEFGKSDHGLWAASLLIEPPTALPVQWHEEDTILGDYLRVLGDQADKTMSISLAEYAGEVTETDPAINELSLVASGKREHILRRVAVTGVEYLSRQEHEA